MSSVNLEPVAEPGTPSSGVEIWMGTDKKLRQKDTAGIVSILTPDGTNFLNYIDNGGFAINQRVAEALTTLSASNGGAPSATNRVATIDRWLMITQTIASPQFQRVDTMGAVETGISARYYAKYKQITGNGKQMVTQTMTAIETARLRGKTVRFQAKLKYAVTAGGTRIMKMGIIQNAAAATVDTLAAGFVSAWNGNGSDPTLGANLAYIVPLSTGLDNCTVASNGLSCTLTSNWQRFSGTFTVPSDCKNLTLAFWNNEQLIAASSEDWCVTECGKYMGAEIMDWAPISLELELHSCERMFCKSFPLGTVPAQNAGTNGAQCGVIAKAGATALAAKIFIRFPVRMYKTPATPVLYSPSSAAAQPWRIDGTTPAVQSAAAISQTSDVGFVVTATGDAAGAIGDMVGVQYSADGEI